MKQDAIPAAPVKERLLHNIKWTDTCAVHYTGTKLIRQYPEASGFLVPTYQTILRQTQRRGQAVSTTSPYSSYREQFSVRR